MMHKHPQAVEQWSLDLIRQCQQRQLEILGYAIECLKPNGTLVYSTCTYAKEENEEVISIILERYPMMKLDPVDVPFGREGGIPGTRRIFPMDGGEGQFMARLIKTDGSSRSLKEKESVPVSQTVRTFLKDQLNEPPLFFDRQRDKIYCRRQPFYDFSALHLLRQGICIGQEKKNRIEPAHSFYMNADWVDTYRQRIDLDIEQMNAFMHGLSVSVPFRKGYVAVCIDGIPFGFGKSDGTTIKNKIPKGLRLLEKSRVSGQ